jgi:predicted acyl esterase
VRPFLVLAAAGLVLAAFAGCLDHPAPVTPSGTGTPALRLSVAQWKAQLSKPVYKGIDAAVHFIPAADGTKLSLTTYLPQGLPAGTKVPTVMEITPYDAPTPTGTPVVGGTDPGTTWSPYVLAGAAYVAADARGTNGSAGCLDFGGSADRSDARAFVAWVRAQPWSNGVVVTDGVSHPGMGSVVAHAAIPDLTGALADAPVVSYYQDEWEQGAKYEDQVNGEGYQEVELAPGAYADPNSVQDQAAPCTGSTLLDFNTPTGAFTPMWADRDLSRHTNATGSPILFGQGFIDQNVHPDHVQKYWEALPADYPKYAVWGFWYHGYPDMTGTAAKDFQAMRHRWFDALLFGKDNGALAEPHVLLQDSTGTWHEGNRWPLEPSVNVTLWPDGAGGGLSATAAAAGAASYRDLPGITRGTWTNSHVAFRTEPMARDMLVNGAPTLHLVASSNVDQTKWVAYLLDEAPDGSWQYVSHGYADSHTWDGEAQWKTMAPGTPYTWTIRLFPTGTVVAAGHRLTLLVTSQDSRLAGLATGIVGVTAAFCFDDHRGGCYDPSGILPATTVGQATNTIVTGPAGTSIDLAWVDPTLTVKMPTS